MNVTIGGLPLHPLVVHFAVVLIPLAAVLVAAAAVSPRFRVWAGYVPLGASALALVIAPITTSSGEALEGDFEKAGKNMDLIHRHAELGDTGVWLAVGVFVVAVAVWWINRAGQAFGKPVHLAVSALSIVMLVVTLVMITLIGHTGAAAAWQDALPK